MLSSEFFNFIVGPLSYLDRHRQMRVGSYLLKRFRSSPRGPFYRGVRVRRLIEPKPTKSLQQPDKEESSLMISKLLSEADPRSSVEWTKDEWVWGEILV